MIVRLRHVVSCTYEHPVAFGAHLLRLRPRSLAWQRVLGFTLAVDPVPSRQRDGVDHFGNAAAWSFHATPHARFEIASEALVELLPRAATPAAPAWEQVADAARNQAWAWREAEFAFPSPLTPLLAEVRAFAAPSFPPGRPIAEAASCLARRIGEGFQHRPGPHLKLAPLACVLASRAGSCPDLAHVLVAGLRSLGLPARSMAGYQLAETPPSARLHAWAACWLGPGLGWLDLDPVGGLAAAREQICLGWARDHGEFSPVRGVALGGGTHVIRVDTEVHFPEAPRDC